MMRRLDSVLTTFATGLRREPRWDSAIPPLFAHHDIAMDFARRSSNDLLDWLFGKVAAAHKLAERPGQVPRHLLLR